MHNRSAIRLRIISVLFFSFLAGCYNDFGFVKNGIIPIGNHLYLVVQTNVNELIIGTTPLGALIPTQKTWKGKLRTEAEIVRYDKQSKTVSSLAKMERPDSGSMVIIFRPKHVEVHEGDGDKSVHKHHRGLDQSQE